MERKAKEDADGRGENVRVVIRFRPLNSKEKDSSASFRLNLTGQTIEIGDHTFAFDQVFGPPVGQETVFNSIAKNAVDWVCQGYNATVFVYGATSSGKSYSMFGTKDDPGIIPRCCTALFDRINNNEDVTEATLKCSFLEIYREHIRDLLTTSPASLRIRSGPKGNYVQGLTEKYVYSPEDILTTISDGATQRTTASTALNAQSSRSHAVLTLILTQNFVDGSETVSKMHLIDLAGSENVGRSEVQGITLAEAQTINKSLSCLGNVIYALTEKGRDHVPYRDSKLTYLLQDSLGGNSRTILIATASPSQLCYSETLNTLKFAQRAKQIKNIPVVNKNLSQANLLQTIELLQKRIGELEKQCEDSKAIIQAVEVAKPDDQETVLLRVRSERLEQNVRLLQRRLADEIATTELTRDFFDKQRHLAQKIARDLYQERIHSFLLSQEVKQYRMWRQSLQEAPTNILDLLVKRFNVNLTVDVDHISPVDSDIDLPSPV